MASSTPEFGDKYSFTKGDSSWWRLGTARANVGKSADIINLTSPCFSFHILWHQIFPALQGLFWEPLAQQDKIVLGKKPSRLPLFWAGLLPRVLLAPVVTILKGTKNVVVARLLALALVIITDLQTGYDESFMRRLSTSCGSDSPFQPQTVYQAELTFLFYLVYFSIFCQLCSLFFFCIVLFTSHTCY